MIRTLPSTTQLVEGLSDNFGGALIHISHLLPILVEGLNRWGPRLYHKLDILINWIARVFNTHTPAIVAMINSWPQFSHWISDIYEPAWGTHNVTYIPPQVAISPSQAGAICDGLRQRNVPNVIPSSQ